MDLRICSGLVQVHERHRQRGTAIVTFYPSYSIEGDVEPVRGDDFRVIGPYGPFVSEPLKIVSLRSMEFVDSDTRSFGAAPPLHHVERWNIDDHFDHLGRLVINWTSRSSAAILEIAYMVIGYVDD